MAVIRVNKTKNYTVMSNTHLRDMNLSLKAKGLLSLMLSLPEDWDYSVDGLESICNEGKRAIKSAIKELKDEGYLVVTKLPPSKDNGGKYEYIYDIFETPTIEQNNKLSINCTQLDSQEAQNEAVQNVELQNVDLQDVCLQDVELQNVCLNKYTKELNTEEQNTKKQNKENNYCSELKNHSELEVKNQIVISLVLNDKSLFGITQEQVDHWSKLYPAVDVLQQLKNMQGWIEANPKRRKTKGGILRFVNAWLAKAQDKGGSLYGKTGGNTQQEPTIQPQQPDKPIYGTIL